MRIHALVPGNKINNKLNRINRDRVDTGNNNGFVSKNQFCELLLTNNESMLKFFLVV